MTALIKGCFRLSKSEIEEMTEDEFYEAWGQAKFYLETIHQVNFS
jgi:hypothetical protein